MEIIAVYEFELNRLNVEPELLGSIQKFIFNNLSMELCFPKKGEEQLFSGKDLGGSVSLENELVCQEIMLLKISVNLELPISSFLDIPEKYSFDKINSLLESTAEIVKTFLQKYITYLRTKCQQSWLAYSMDVIKVTRCSYFCKETGERSNKGGYIEPIKITCPSESLVLSIEDHKKAMQHVLENQDIDLSDSLIADARYMAWATETNHFREAILFAAFAVEQKIKNKLINLCNSSTRELLQIVLKNKLFTIRETEELYNSVAKAITGNTFLDTGYFNDLKGLFQTRNKIAHLDTTSIEPDIVRKHLEVAQKAIDWVDNLSNQT